MIILRTIITAIVLLFIIIYACFVLITSNPCTRIDRATIPVRYASEFAKTMAKPWSQPETLQSIDQWSAKQRLRMAILFRIQFYSDAVPPVRCDWDIYKESILGSDNGLIQKEKMKEAERQNANDQQNMNEGAN